MFNIKQKIDLILIREWKKIEDDCVICILVFNLYWVTYSFR